MADALGRVPPRRFSPARIAFFRTVERCAAWLGGRRFYRRRYLAPGRLCVRHEDVSLPDHAGALDGYRIAVLSDLHAGSFLAAEDLGHVLAEVRRSDPHAVCLLGDYVVHSIEEARALVPALAELRAPHGVFAVFGNHDYRGRREQELVDALAPHGVRFLRNAAQRVRVPSGRPGEPDVHLAFVGIEDAEEGRVVDVVGARRGVLPGDVEVALSHNPRAAAAFAAPPTLERSDPPIGPPASQQGRGLRGARLVLSGHTHGTQLDLPFLRRLGPPHPGLRVEFGATTLLVTRGIGVVGVPWRVGAPAELLVVTFRAQPRDVG